MEITYQAGDIATLEASLAIVGAFSGETLPAQFAALVEDGDFTGRFKQTLLLYPWAGIEPLQVGGRNGSQARTAAIAARRLVLVGLGARSELTPERVRQAYAVAAQKAA